MTVTCTYSELKEQLAALTEAGSYRVVITDPSSVVLGSSDTEGTLGYIIKSYSEEHLSKGIYLDLSSSDLTFATILSTTGSLSGAFKDCTQLTDIDDLPRQVSSSNYSNMFAGCSHLRTASVSNLPITAASSVDGMFTGCASLVVLTVDKAFVTATASATNLLKDCTVLKQIVVSDSSHPALINKDTGINGDLVVQGTSYVQDQSTFGKSVIAAGAVYGSGALKRDADGNLIQDKNSEYSTLATSEMDETAEHIDSFIGNATSASKLNHAINLRLNGEITGYVSMKTYEKDGETVVVNTINTEVNSLNSTDNDNNIYKIVTKDYLNQQLSKIKVSSMLKIDSITSTKYVLDDTSYDPEEGVIYLVPSGDATSTYSTENGYNDDTYNAYEEYIWEAKYSPVTKEVKRTGVLTTIKVESDKENTLNEETVEATDVSATVTDDDVTSNPVTEAIYSFTYDGQEYKVKESELDENNSYILIQTEPVTENYTITSTATITNASVVDGQLYSVTEGSVEYIAVFTKTSDGNATVTIKKVQKELEDLTLITEDGSEVTYSYSGTETTLEKTGDYAWEHIGNTALNLSDYLTNTILKKGFKFEGDVSTTKSLTVDGTTQLGKNSNGYILTVDAQNNKVTSDAAVQINSDLTTTGKATIGGTEEVTGALTAKSTLDVTGKTTLAGALDVTGDTTVNKLTAQLATELQSTLEVKGVTTLDKTLEVKEGATFDSTTETKGAATFDSTVEVKGVTTLDKTLEVKENTTLDAALEVKGATTLDSTLTSKGNVVVGTTYTEETTDENGTVHKVGDLKYDATIDGKTAHTLTIKQTKSGVETPYVYDNTKDLEISIQQSKLTTEKTDDIASVDLHDYDGSNDVTNVIFAPDQNVNTTSNVKFGSVEVDGTTYTSKIDDGITVSATDTTDTNSSEITSAGVASPKIEAKDSTNGNSTLTAASGSAYLVTGKESGTLYVNGKAIAFGADVDSLLARIAALEAKVEAFSSSSVSADAVLTDTLLSKWGVNSSVNTSSSK